jgi:RimJ/RimL family protein N-acetyltransferase
MTPLLEGRHVRLEPLTQGHLDALWEVAREEGDAFRWTSVPDTRELLGEYLERALAASDQQAFATVDRTDGRVVGSTRFLDIQRWRWPVGLTDPRAGDAQAVDALEIGFTWLSARARRTAINTEAKLLMLTHAFEVLRARRVQLKTDARNEVSRNAIQRLGARFEGVLRQSLPAADGGVRDTAYFSILAAEWPVVKAALSERVR